MGGALLDLEVGLEEGRRWTVDALSSVEMVRFAFLFSVSLFTSHMI